MEAKVLWYGVVLVDLDGSSVSGMPCLDGSDEFSCLPINSTVMWEFGLVCRPTPHKKQVQIGLSQTVNITNKEHKS